MSTGKPNQDSPIAFRGWALMLGNAAHWLESSCLQFSLPSNRMPGRATMRYSCQAGGIILRALSVELALKFLAYLRTGRHDLGHDLWKLYRDLDDQTRDVIQAVDQRSIAESGFPPISEILKDNRDAFVSFRYPSLPMTGPSFLNLGRAHDVLVAAIDDPAFRQLCPERTHQ